MSPMEQAARALAAAYNGIVRADPLPCCHCGKVPEVDPNGGYPVISCDDCYSGPPDFCASGLTRAQAVADWNDRMEQEEPFVECPKNLVSGSHVYAPLDPQCIHCQTALPRRAVTP